MTPEGKILRWAIAHAKALGCLCLRLSFRPGVTSGWPDLLVLGPSATLIFLEFKRAGGTPTPLQANMLRQLRELGFTAEVCDSFDAARDAIASAMDSRTVHAAGRPPS